MKVGTIAVLTATLFSVHVLNAQSNQPPLVHQTLQAGAAVENLTSVCTQKNSRNGQQYQAELNAWQQRNYWSAIRAQAAPGEYEAASTKAQQAIRSQGMKSIILCMNFHQVLTSPTFDPSKQHAQELAALASGGGSGSQMQGAPGTGTQSAGAQGQVAPPQQSLPSQSQQAQGQQALGGQQSSMQPPPVQAPAMAAVGGKAQVGDGSFNVPRGWQQTKSDANEAIFRRPAKDNEVQLYAFMQRPMQGDFKGTFAAAVRGMFPGTTPKLEHIYPALTTTGLPALYVRDGSKLRNNKSAALRAVGVQLPNQQLFLVLLVSTDHYSGLTAAEKDLTAAVSSLRFRTQTNATEWNAVNAHGQGNANALYWYNTITLMPNPLGGLDTRAVRKYVILLPGGRAYEDLPEDGHVLDMNFEAACQKKPEYCGSYTIQGSTIKMRWPEDFGLTQESTGAYVPNQTLETLGNKYSIAPPAKSSQISGRYRSFFAMVGNTVTNSTSVSSEKFITFTPDGRYQKQGFSAASFTNTGAAGTFQNKRGPEAGTYKLEGYTMTLTPQAGPPQTYTVVMDYGKGGPNPSAVFINDEGYLP